MTAEQIKQHVTRVGYGRFKYVRLKDGFRFCDIMVDHSILVKTGEVAISAGHVVFNESGGLYTDHYSMTLKIGRASDDDNLLAEIFGMPVLSDE